MLRPQSQTYKQVSDDQKEQVSTVLKNTTNGRKKNLRCKLSKATHIEENQHSGAHPFSYLSTSSNITVNYNCNH